MEWVAEAAAGSGGDALLLLRGVRAAAHPTPLPTSSHRLCHCTIATQHKYEGEEVDFVESYFFKMQSPEERRHAVEQRRQQRLVARQQRQQGQGQQRLEERQP